MHTELFQRLGGFYRAIYRLLWKQDSRIFGFSSLAVPSFFWKVWTRKTSENFQTFLKRSLRVVHGQQKYILKLYQTYRVQSELNILGGQFLQLGSQRLPQRSPSDPSSLSSSKSLFPSGPMSYTLLNTGELLKYRLFVFKIPTSPSEKKNLASFFFCVRVQQRRETRRTQQARICLFKKLKFGWQPAVV